MWKSTVKDDDQEDVQCILPKFELSACFEFPII